MEPRFFALLFFSKNRLPDAAGFLIGQSRLAGGDEGLMFHA